MIYHVRRSGVRRIAIVLATTALVGIVAVPAILAAGGTPGPNTAAMTPAVGTAPGAGGGVGRILRGDATVLKRDGTTATIHFERGEVTALSPTAITLKGLDGVSTTFAIDGGTRVRGGGRRLALSDVKVGSRVAVLGPHAATGTSTASVIRLLPAGRKSGAGGGAGATPAQPVAPSPSA